jgi:hypothetical protein
MFWLLIVNGDPSGWEKEVEIISQAPAHFAAALIALFVVIVLPASLLGWGITSHITRKNLEAEFSGKINGQSERLEIYKEKITELEKQLQNQLTLPPQSSLEPPKLLPAEVPTNKPSQAELRMQALKTANALYSAIKEAKRQSGGAEVNVELLYETQLSDFRNTKYKHIVDSFLRYYSKDLHDSAVELKTKILVPEGMKLLGVGNYTNPQGLRDLEAIAQDLKNISTSPIAQP